MKQWWWLLWLAYSVVALFTLVLVLGDETRWPPLGCIVPVALFLLPTLALVAWGVRAGYTEADRDDRRRRRICLRCGYDLRATPGRCPECGAPRADGE